MIKCGNFDISLPNVRKVYAGNRLVWLSDILPSGYTALSGITFDGNSRFITSIVLTGDDTLRFRYRASKSCNVIGSYVSASADNNFSYYHTGSSYVRYDGNLFRTSMSNNTDYSVVFSKSGFVVNSSDVLTWSPETFTCNAPLWIGMLPNSSAASFSGVFWGNIEIDGKFKGIPCKRNSDEEIGYFDVYSDEFLTNQGTGSVSTA